MSRALGMLLNHTRMVRTLGRCLRLPELPELLDHRLQLLRIKQAIAASNVEFNSVAQGIQLQWRGV